MHYEILDENRIKILPNLKNFKDRFYLAGGTGLALQIGHRDSIDFDFFCDSHFDTEKLFSEIKDILAGHIVKKYQEEKDTLGIIIDDEVKLSFMRYSYQLLNKCIEDDSLRIASIGDIACMKLSAIVSRSAMKDYVDIYFILKSMTLSELLEMCEKKIPELDQNLILKSLVYFGDITSEKIIFKNNNDVSMQKIENFLVDEVKKIR